MLYLKVTSFEKFGISFRDDSREEHFPALDFSCLFSALIIDSFTISGMLQIDPLLLSGVSSSSTVNIFLFSEFLLFFGQSCDLSANYISQYKIFNVYNNIVI